MMESFSLEDEEGHELFLTQQSKDNSSSNNGEIGDEIEPMEFFVAENQTSNLFGEVGEESNKGVVYSDISDPEDDFENPVYGRYVVIQLC